MDRREMKTEEQVVTWMATWMDGWMDGWMAAGRQIDIQTHR
jgi:hypothetical protein